MLSQLISVVAVATLASTAYFADVPFLPIEISKMGNHGTAYWCFSVGGAFLSVLLLLLHAERDTLWPSSIISCASLVMLTTFSDHAWFRVHLLSAVSFFTSSMWFAARRSGLGHWTVVGAITCYGLRALALPLQLLAAAQQVQQMRALFQWATVACLLANHCCIE